MECAKCGSELVDGAVFCSRCGASRAQQDAVSGSSTRRQRAIKGRILDYDWKTNSGVISGEDGFRYDFSSSDWNNDQAPRIGVTVEFIADADRAIEIYLLRNIRSVSAGSIESKRFIAGLLGILLGLWGIHKFYLGYNQEGIIMLIAGTIGWILVLPGLVAFVVGVVEGVIYITKSDEEFDELYVEGRRPWF